ncbi:MAG: Asp23/Gls24 family envelope stress response protein [Coriobacteriia bacterium]|nr:Asp23/Gls24 family envelope stress response protein [Coriobacteriia bacterium]
MTEKLGSISISDEVLMDLAGYAALESYGVVGMASPTLVDEVVQLLPRNKLRKGVHISLVEDPNAQSGAIEVDLYVIIEYGTNLSQVSRNLADRVRYTLTEFAGITVGRVDIHVLEVKVR